MGQNNHQCPQQSSHHKAKLTKYKLFILLNSTKKMLAMLFFFVATIRSGFNESEPATWVPLVMCDLESSDQGQRLSSLAILVSA